MAKPYLAMCTMYRDHAADLAEWIEFHRLVGAERFFLYDNGSTDNHREVLAPYIEEGLVVLHDWPVRPGLVEAFDHCAREHAADARWIAFIDIDEFLFSPTGRPLPEVLARYEPWSAVGVNRVTFGTSGHEHRRPGLVLENYTRRIVLRKPVKTAMKSIVDPRRVVRGLGPHHFEYSSGFAVDEAENPLEAQFTVTDSCDVRRVNHYFTRSAEERVAKMARPRAGGGELRPESIEPGKGLREDRRLGVEDDAILRHLPALREELARVGGG